MFRSLTKLDYLLKETGLGLLRGGWVNWAAVSTVTVLLFLFGLSWQFSWQVETLLNQFGNQLSLVVFLQSGISAANVVPLITQMLGVATVEVITKEQAWTKLVQDLGITDIAGATQQLGDNPLVDEITVKALNSQIVSNLAIQLAKLPGVDLVQYADEAVKRLAQLQQGLSWITLTITIILTFTAIAVTTTTIHLIMLARRREIEIMQLVGATSTWIHLPFIFQGISFGLFGGAIAWGFISLTQQFLNRLLAHQPDFIRFLHHGLQLTPTQTLLLPLILLSFGAVVGLIGSLLAVLKLDR